MSSENLEPTPLQVLQQALFTLAGIDEQEFQISEGFWQFRKYEKKESFNDYKQVCKYLGFVLEGVFRTYFIQEETGEEKNVFFFSKHQVISSFQSFLTQSPCKYYTQAMTESQVLYIHKEHLDQLYNTSHKWERMGRLMAEMAFGAAMSRAESFMFTPPEERYLELVAQHPDLLNEVPLYHISSYLGIQGPSLSRIRKRISGK
ncbi:Crp/Fnr family transcriptional regulator [Limibacter armeniacum]|uniref:Crp/Fnr family transcriptional regulator n=1 Tax=Limibacter armeniacum TaxID=466084 RepID=UPI002FE66534